jgi:hypothetical protein
MVPRAAAPESAPHRDRFGLVLGLLVASLVASVVLTNAQARVVILLLFVAALLVALRSARLPGRTRRVVWWTMTTGSLLVVAYAIAVGGEISGGVASAWIAFVTATAVGVVVGRIMRHVQISLQTVFGALSAYLLIGFMFAAVFAMTAHLEDAAFFADGDPESVGNMQYFSFVTLTTTGYGDLTAATETGRALVVIEALLGQIFLVTLVARLVALYGTSRPVPPPSGPGQDETTRQRDHPGEPD